MKENVLVSWMRKNASLFRHAGTSFQSLSENGSKILLFGRFSSSLYQFYRNIAGEGFSISVFTDDEDGSMIPVLMGSEIIGEIDDMYDYVSFPLELSLMDTHTVTGALITLSEHICSGGILYFSFVERTSLGEDEDGLYHLPFLPDGERGYLKRYMLGDIVGTLGALSYEITALERDDSPIGPVVSVVARKK